MAGRSVTAVLFLGGGPFGSFRGILTVSAPKLNRPGLPRSRGQCRGSNNFIDNSAPATPFRSNPIRSLCSPGPATER
jgi:hypothetical protein